MSSEIPKLVPVDDSNASPSKVEGIQVIDLTTDDIPEPQQPQAQSEKGSAVAEDQGQVMAARPPFGPVDDSNASPSKVEGSQVIDLTKDDVPEPHGPQAQIKKGSAVTKGQKQVMAARPPLGHVDDGNASPSKVEGNQVIDLTKDDVPEPHQPQAQSEKHSAVTEDQEQVMAARPPFGPVDDGSKTPPPPPGMVWRDKISLAEYMKRHRRSAAEEKRPAPAKTGSKKFPPLEERFRFAHDLDLFTATLAEVTRRDMKREAEAEAEEWFKNLAAEKAAEEEAAKREAAKKEAAAKREAIKRSRRAGDVRLADDVEGSAALPEVARFESTTVSDNGTFQNTSSPATKSSSKNTRTPKNTPPKRGADKAKAVESSPKNPARVTKSPQSSQSSGKKSGAKITHSDALKKLMDIVEKEQEEKEKEKQEAKKRKPPVSAAGIPKKAVPKTRSPAVAPAVEKEAAKQAVPELISPALPPGIQRALAKSSSASSSGTYSRRASVRTSTPSSSIATGPWMRWREVSPKSRPRATAAQAMEEAGIRQTPKGLRIVNKFHYLKPLGTPLYEPPPLAVREIKVAKKKKAKTPPPEEKVNNRLCRAHDIDIFPTNILNPNKTRKRDDSSDSEDDVWNTASRAAKRAKTAMTGQDTESGDVRAPVRRLGRTPTPEPEPGSFVRNVDTRAGRKAALLRTLALKKAREEGRYVSYRY